MTKRRQGMVVTAIALLLVTLQPARGSVIRAEQPSGLPEIMRQKLNYAQDVLRALVLEDYSSLDRAAQQLAGLTRLAAWGVLKTPEYARYSNEFLRATEGLSAAARSRKLEASAGEYGNLTQGCVNCHRYIRGARLALADPLDPTRSPAAAALFAKRSSVEP